MRMTDEAKTPFLALIDAVRCGKLRGKSRPWHRAFKGQGHVLEELRHCEDQMPGIDCDSIHLPAGTTYGQAVRHLKRWLKGQAVEL